MKKQKKDAIQKDIQRNKRLQSLYGIGVIDYEILSNSQGGVCAICKSPPKTKRLCVDHRHEKDKKGKQVKGDISLVRGLLCMWCNKYILGAIERRNTVSPRLIINELMNYSSQYKLKGDS